MTASFLPRDCRFLNAWHAGKEISASEMKSLRDGIIICTNCDRCTVVCPSGINLRDLWLNVREDLVGKEITGQPLLLSTFSFVRGLNKEQNARRQIRKPVLSAKESVIGAMEIMLETVTGPLTLSQDTGAGADFPKDAASFFACFGCQNCTTVCPVVTGLENPGEELGLLPHQIMYSLGLGLFQQACASGMLWACTTCYQCQEHCPQKVEVTDILYDLKIMALRGPLKDIGGKGTQRNAA